MAIECPTRTIAPCAAGDGAACITPPVVVACTAELPCNEDIPYVLFYQPPVSALDQVFVQWHGSAVTYNIEYLVAGKLIETIVGGVDVYTPFHEIDDTGSVADVATGSIGSMTVGAAMTEGYIYSVSLRRVTATAVGVWSQAIFVASGAASPIYIVDGDYLIVDDNDDIIQTPIIDGYP